MENQNEILNMSGDAVPSETTVTWARSSLNPVSYTHLDVYKRQEIRIKPAWSKERKLYWTSSRPI